MKVVVTHLKAPWPPGSRPGDVVELIGDVVPGWAAGKCRPATQSEADAAEALAIVQAARAEDDERAAAALAEAEDQAQRERAAIEAKAAKGSKAAKG